jgi:hypothetical protein
VAALVMAVISTASAQDIDLNPIKGAAPDIKQEEPNAKTVTELETPKAQTAKAGDEVAEGGPEAGAEDGETASPDEDKKKGKKGKKEKKERKSRKKKEDA